jgi:hypothetical protein
MQKRDPFVSHNKPTDAEKYSVTVALLWFHFLKKYLQNRKTCQNTALGIKHMFYVSLQTLFETFSVQSINYAALARRNAVSVLVLFLKM